MLLAEEERLHDALDGDSVDRRKTPGIGSPILDELVAVMSALRLLCRENKAGAQLSDYLVESTVIFPFFAPQTSKRGLKNASSSDLAEAIDWICKALKNRKCCGHRTCVLRFADRNPAVTPPACQSRSDGRQVDGGGSGAPACDDLSSLWRRRPRHGGKR